MRSLSFSSLDRNFVSFSQMLQPLSNSFSTSRSPTSIRGLDVVCSHRTESHFRSNPNKFHNNTPHLMECCKITTKRTSSLRGPPLSDSERFSEANKRGGRPVVTAVADLSARGTEVTRHMNTFTRAVGSARVALVATRIPHWELHFSYLWPMSTSPKAYVANNIRVNRAAGARTVSWGGGETESTCTSP
jgi:hypothetical protein